VGAGVFRVRRLVAALVCVGISLALPPTTLLACEIELAVKRPKGSPYHEGDQVVLQVSVFLTHKDCPDGVKLTKFTATGLKILGATKWKQVAPERFVRLFKAKVEGATDGAAVFHAKRTCDKEGAYAQLKLDVSPTEGAPK